MNALAEDFADLDEAPLPLSRTDERREWQLAGDDKKEDRQPAAICARLYPINRLGKQALSRPIVVTLEFEDESVVMNSPALRIWGSGKDAYEAFGDFVATFWGVLESYRRTPDTELSPEAIQYRHRLESFLR